MGVFRLWGYREVMTPTYEFFDVLAVGTDESLQERMFKFVDRETGRMLALRADVTPQIARIAATRLRDRPKPHRLAYRTNVFRYDEPRVGRQREFYQAGVELIGLDKPEADAEMIAMAVEGFRAAGLRRFQIEVGQVEFARGVIESLGVEREVGRALVTPSSGRTPPSSSGWSGRCPSRRRRPTRCSRCPASRAGRTVLAGRPRSSRIRAPSGRWPASPRCIAC